MKHSFFLVVVVAILFGTACANAQTPNSKGQVCHLEQQCHWENFKKTCVWVKVCR
jgi:hypothetical protein